MARFTPLPHALGWLALALLSAGQALPWAIGGGVGWFLAAPERDAPTPRWRAFALGVYLATLVPAIFPWTPAGGLAGWPVLLQTAELVGERGTSFLVAAACGLLVDAMLLAGRARPLAPATRPLAAAVAVAVVLLTYGRSRMASIARARDAAPHARIALLQPDFDPVFHWEKRRSEEMLDRLSVLTRNAEREGALLTVWPESAYPYTLPHGTDRSPQGSRAVLQPGVRGPVLTGLAMNVGGGLSTNSAILVEPDGTIGPSYDKRHLLWFGETVPMADTFPVLRHVFARGVGIEPGREAVAFQAGPVRAAVLNCYEDTLPLAGREAMAVEPNLLVNVTNDAWFTGSAEGELHLRLAVLRAIETRRDLVRAVNRGPTTWVDAAGRVRMRHEGLPGAGPSPPLLADAALLQTPPTLYVRAGDVPLATLLVVALGSVWLRARARRRSAAPLADDKSSAGVASP
jgi:apolipoprotein N-acyltransferase